jgi:Zn-dependent M28 family amino/carboxypeptidase
MSRIAVALSFALLIAAPAIAQQPATTLSADDLATATKLRDQALEDGTAYATLESLTSDIGPRLAGGVNDARARDWAAARFKTLGFDKVWTEEVKFPKWERRSESAALTSPSAQPLAVTALGGSVGTPKGGVTAQIVAFKTFDDLKNATPEQLKGRIAFVGYHMSASRDGHDYGNAVRSRVDGASIAAKGGALAIVIRSIGSDHDRLPHTGVLHYADGAPKIPAAAVSNSDADLIEHLVARSQPVSLKLALDCGTKGEYTSANVIGEIRGTKNPEQIVVIGGHLDSWDLGTGAIDDGAGVAITMAAGALIAKLPQHPKRSIRVIAFSNEEAGLFGGKAYALAHKDEIAQHVLGSESDFGAGRVWHINTSVKPSALGAIDQIMQVLAPLGIERGHDASGGGPDVGPMHAAGMAAISLGQDGSDYFNWHHTANDTFDKIEPKALAQNVAAWVTVAYLAAQADGDFGSQAGAFANEKGE